jgi:hypothetical protein
MREFRVIFEKGFELRRNKIGLWSFMPSRGIQLSISPSKITQEYQAVEKVNKKFQISCE